MSANADDDALVRVADDELLYRKIPVSQNWYDPAVSDNPSPEAFHPHFHRDTSGISVDRARSAERPEFRTIEQAGRGNSREGYYVAVLRTGDLRQRGIEVAARPLDENPGHAELPGLRADNRKSSDVRQWKRMLADEFTLRVEGPFSVQSSQSGDSDS